MTSAETIDRLSAHIRFHTSNRTQQKQFFCGHCDTDRSSSDNLYHHLQEKHGDQLIRAQLLLLKKKKDAIMERLFHKFLLTQSSLLNPKDMENALTSVLPASGLDGHNETGKAFKTESPKALIDPENLPNFSSSNGFEIQIRLKGTQYAAIGDFNVSENCISMKDMVHLGAMIIEYHTVFADREPPVFNLQIKGKIIVPLAYTYLPWQTTADPQVYEEERFEIIETFNSPPVLGCVFLNTTGIWPPRGPNRDRFEKRAEMDRGRSRFGMTQAQEGLKCVLPITLNGKVRCAQMDTGSVANLISESYLRELSLQVLPRSSKPFMAPFGKQIVSLGTVEISLRLSNSRTVHTAKFHVVKELTDDTILIGAPFLSEVGALTHNQHLTQVVDSRNEDKYVPGQKHVMECYLDGKHDVAVLDPGHFGGNVMALSHAVDNKYPIDASRRRNLELGGGQVSQKSEGVVTTTFHLGHLFGAATPQEFTVVKDWTENITIGNHTIMSTAALSRQYEAYREKLEPEIVGPIFGSGIQVDGVQRRLLDVWRRSCSRLSSAREYWRIVRGRLERIDERLRMRLPRRERRRLEMQREREVREVRAAELAAMRVVADERRAAAEERRAAEELQDLRDNVFNAGVNP